MRDVENRVQELSRLTFLQESLIEKALDKFKNKECFFFGVSGKIASGKDSVSRLIFDDSDVAYDSFSDDLKKEVSNMINILKYTNNAKKSAESYSLYAPNNVSLNEATKLVEIIADEVFTGELKSAYDRTPACRSALQFWGSDVRRKQDPYYWVKPVVSRALIRAASLGKSTIVTDVRFKTEAEGVLLAGGSLIRLDVSKEKQVERVQLRDGLTPTSEQLNHSSEISLDDFQDFTLRLDTDKFEGPEDVAKVITRYLMT